MSRVVTAVLLKIVDAVEPESNALEHCLHPVVVSDAGDPRIVHLHGLNLSRAWCWTQLLDHVGAKLQLLIRESIDRHLDASLCSATNGAYVGTHWLASFALLATTEQAVADTSHR